MFLDNDDVERSLGITKLPNAFFNLRRGWYTAQDDEIMRQHWEQNPLEKARRDAEAAALQQQQQQQTTKQPE
jgi:hypothetical protein